MSGGQGGAVMRGEGEAAPLWCRHLRLDLALGGLLQLCLDRVTLKVEVRGNTRVCAGGQPGALVLDLAGLRPHLPPLPSSLPS